MPVKLVTKGQVLAAAAILVWVTLLVPFSLAQQASPTTTASVVPRLITFSGVLKDGSGHALEGVVGVTFSLYKEQDGGAALWLETQNVEADSLGHYTVLLGATKPNGLPTELFTSGEARWLGVQPAGQAEQPRVLLVSAPYALKAGDAETVGGLAPSAFVLASPPSGSSPGPVASPLALPPATGTTPVTTAGGVVNQLAKFDATADVTSSQVFDNGTNVGIGNTAPAAKLDVSGGGIIRGALQLPATAAATSTAGTNSNVLTLTASSFKSGTGGGAVNQNFRWQAEPSGNNTAAPSGTLNLLFGSGTATPAETGLSISNGGALTVRGMTLPSVAAASSTSTAGFPSRPMDLLASAWNTSGTPAAVSEHFRWQAEPAGSNTATPSATLNLLYASGAAAPAETGLKIGSNGNIAFAAGQAFPGTGSGTVHSVASGAGLTGGPITSSGTLSIATGGVTNAMLVNPTLSVLAGTDLAGGGSVPLGGSTTLNLDTTKVPQLNTANSFTGNQTVNGNLSATGVVNASGFEIGSALFDYGSPTALNAFLGFAGANTITTGTNNTASGPLALYSVTTGSNNTASGYQALFNNNGSYNTAIGDQALYLNPNSTNSGTMNTAVGHSSLYNNFAGSYNTALGSNAGNTTNGNATLSDYNTFLGYQTTPGIQAFLSNSTAVGAFAEVDISNAMVLGSINGVNGATADTLVGIGITAPTFKLHVGAINRGFRVEGPSKGGAGTLLASFGGNGDFGIDAPNIPNGRFYVQDTSGHVGIGHNTPPNILSIGQNLGSALADGWATYSSRRWKTNIHTLHGALAKVERLRGVSYDLKASGKHEVGVIAEEVGAVVPEIVTFEDNGKDARSVDYSRLTALLIEATKEQQTLIQKQQQQIKGEQAQIKVQQAQIAGLASQVKTIRVALRSGRADSQIQRANARLTDHQ